LKTVTKENVRDLFLNNQPEGLEEWSEHFDARSYHYIQEASQLHQKALRNHDNKETSGRKQTTSVCQGQDWFIYNIMRYSGYSHHKTPRQLIVTVTSSF